jgi:hypothetical protein
MARRSLWAMQDKKYRKKLHEKHQSQLSPSAKSTLRLIRKGESASNKDKLRFLEEHKDIFGRVMRKYSRDQNLKGAKNLTNEQWIDFIGEDVDKHLLDFAGREVSKLVVKERLNPSISSFKKGFKKYIIDREIPFDKSSFEKAFEIYAIEEHVEKKAEKSNPREFERIYLRVRKEKRHSELMSRNVMNRVIKMSFRDMNLTPNQRKTLMRWGLKNRETLFDLFNAKIKGKKVLTEIQYSRIFDEVEIDFARIMREKFIKDFKNNPKVTQAITKKTQNSIKNGTREQRMKKYNEEKRNSNSKEESRRKRSEELERKMSASSKTGKRFDPTNHALSEIKKESSSTAKELNRLLKNGTISRHSIRSLYINGTLAQRTFMRALRNGATSEIGRENFNALVRMISFIGPGGKKINSLIRSTQSPNASEIFKFLKRKGLLEVDHGGGQVAYLKR